MAQIPSDESCYSLFHITKSDHESFLVAEFDGSKIKDCREHVTSDKSKVLDSHL